MNGGPDFHRDEILGLPTCKSLLSGAQIFDPYFHPNSQSTAPALPVDIFLVRCHGWRRFLLFDTLLSNRSEDFRYDREAFIPSSSWGYTPRSPKRLKAGQDNPRIIPSCGPLAQSVEQLTFNPKQAPLVDMHSDSLRDCRQRNPTQLTLRGINVLGKVIPDDVFFGRRESLLTRRREIEVKALARRQARKLIMSRSDDR